MAWSDNPNYCYRCNTLCQPCSSLLLIIVLLFKFGWLNLLQDPTFNQTGSLFMALQFVFILRCPHSTNIEWSLDGMWNALIPKYCLLFTFLFSDYKDSGGERNPQWAWWNIFMGWQIFWINPENGLKRLIILMYFTCNIYIETSGSA